jgi:hypothetical protein
MSGTAAPSGLLAIWNDIVPEARADFVAWHSREHVPERVGVPGFVRGRRLFGADAAPQYLTLYDVASLAVLTSAAYLTRLNNPTPWTTRVVRHFRRTERAACRVPVRAGAGSGGCVVAGRVWLDDPAAAPAAEAALVRAAAALVACAGVCAVTVGCGDRAASSVPTSERRMRAEEGVPADLIVLVEAFNRSIDAAPLLGAVEEHARAAASAGRLCVDRYDLEFSLGREP